MFPIKNYIYSIPKYNEPGGFGYKRKYDIHTGVDLYCQDGDEVFCIEPGVIIDICKFTGFEESPWWEDTYAVTIKGDSGYILYGEITPIISIGQKIEEGDLIGRVKRFLKKDKGRPTSMLHLELYENYKEPVWWLDDKPENLKDITELFNKMKKVLKHLIIII